MNILQIFIFATAIAALSTAHASSADGGDRLKNQGVCGRYSADKSSDQPQDGSKALQRHSQNRRWKELAKEARAATDLGIESNAAKLSLAAYCIALQGAITNSDRYELGAAALEDLLDAKRYEDANTIYDELKGGLTTIDLARSDRAQLHLQMARARLLSFGDHNTEALGLRESIRPFIVETFGALSEECVTNQIRIANLKIELGRLDEAISDLSNLQTQFQSKTPLRKQGKLLLARAIASAYGLAGREDEALKILRIARSDLVTSTNENDPRVVRIDQSISEILTRIDPSEEALETASRVFLWRDTHMSSDDAQTLRSLWQLAYLYSENARLEASRAILHLLNEKIEQNPKTLPRYFQLQVTSLEAEIDFKQGKYDVALTESEHVYRGSKEIFGDDAVDTQTALATFALALEKSGQIQAGCSLLDRVQKEIASARPEDTWTLEFSRIAYERCQLRNDPNDSVSSILTSMQKSWASIAHHSAPTSRDALNALASYGFALRDAKRPAEAREVLEKYVSLSEQSRLQAARGSAARLAALSSLIFESTPEISPIECYRELALLQAQDKDLEQALHVSELARDRTLGDQFAEQEWLRGKLPAADRAALEPLQERIQDLDERLAVVPDLMERVRLESQRTIAVAQRGRLERGMRARLHLPEPESPPATLDQLRERLGVGTVLVSVMHSGDTWWALVVSHDQPARFLDLADLDLGRVASAWVRRLRGEPVRVWPMPDGRLAVDDLRPSAAVGPFLTTAQLGLRLSATLLGPIAAAAADARHVVFVGDDELVGVPLQALPLDQGLAIDRYDISYAPSLTTYARWQHRPTRARARDLLAIGAIGYPRRTGPAGDDTAAIGLEYAADHPLPQTASEVAAIAAHFAPARRRLLLGAAARKGRLRAASRSGELAGYRYVHLATHAWADPERPEASAVVLASDGGEPPLQVVLTAAELAGLRMDADLIVLSACDTGAGHYEHGRGLLGLAYAALAAGNRAAVLSLWSIADQTTEPFMARFYELLAGGRDPVAALAATQREFRQSADPQLADPAAWAPFLLYGGY